MKKDSSRHLKSFKIIGKNIKDLRESKNLSQEELAFLVSSSRNYIGCIERAEKFPSLAMLLDIANALESNINNICNNA